MGYPHIHRVHKEKEKKKQKKKEKARRLLLNKTSTELGKVIQASYPLWSVFNFGEVKVAKAEKEKQELHLEALMREVSLDVYRTFLDAELADKRVLLQKKTIDEANELLRRITISYEEGQIPFFVFLENIKTIKETRLAYLNALKSYREKVAELERVIQATPVPGGEE